MLKTPTLSPARPSRAKTRQCPSFVLDSQAILNVPHMRKELSWQLVEGGWNLSRLRFLFACDLVGRSFERPHENFPPSISQSSINHDTILPQRSLFR